RLNFLRIRQALQQAIEFLLQVFHVSLEQRRLRFATMHLHRSIPTRRNSDLRDLGLKRVAVLPAQLSGFAVSLQPSNRDFAEDRINVRRKTASSENLRGQQSGP